MTANNKQCQYTCSDTDIKCPYPLVMQPSPEEYCIFHLPKYTDEEQKKYPGEQSKIRQHEKEFSDQFFKLLCKIANDSAKNKYDFSGFQFPSINVNHQFDTGVLFKQAVFVGKVAFSSCIFRRGVDFGNAHFKDAVEFSTIWVQDTQFASLAPTTSEPNPTETTPIQPNGLFLSAVFDSTVTFMDVCFAGIAIFKYATFNSTTNFIKVKFYGESPSVNLDGAVSFAGAAFKEEVIFDNCYFHRLANFQQTSFLKSAKFLAAEKPGCFKAEVNFRKLPLNEKTLITFDKVNLAKASFLDTNVETIIFRDVQWFQFPAKTLFSPRRGAALYDEYLVDQNKYDPDKINYWHKQRAEKYERINEVYRQLVLNYQKKRDFITADEFHIGEMEMKRKKTPSPLNIYALYRFSSNYATSYWRALSVLLIITCLFSTLFLFTGFRPGKDSGEDTGQVTNYDFSLQPERWVSLKQFASEYGKASLLSLSIINKERLYEPLDWETRLCLYVAVGLISAQFTLMLVAIKRRLMPKE